MCSLSGTSLSNHRMKLCQQNLRIVILMKLLGSCGVDTTTVPAAASSSSATASAWATGISAFTVVFAAGHIVGPTLVGWIADGAGGLERGLLVSALALWLGAALASRQRPLLG